MANKVEKAIVKTLQQRGGSISSSRGDVLGAIMRYANQAKAPRRVWQSEFDGLRERGIIAVSEAEGDLPAEAMLVSS